MDTCQDWVVTTAPSQLLFPDISTVYVFPPLLGNSGVSDAKGKKKKQVVVTLGTVFGKVPVK